MGTLDCETLEHLYYEHVLPMNMELLLYEERFPLKAVLERNIVMTVRYLAVVVP